MPYGFLLSGKRNPVAVPMGGKGLVSDSVCIDLYQKTYESQVLYPVGEKYPFYNGISIEPKSVPG